jgi:hypothetical protein
MGIELAVMFTEVRTLNGRDICHLGTDRCRDETMIAKRAIRGIDPHPSGAGKENIDPSVQAALRASIFYVYVELAKKTAHHPDGQTDLPQDGGAKERGITASA